MEKNITNLRNLNAQSSYILCVAMYTVIFFINPANRATGVHTGGVNIGHRLTVENTKIQRFKDSKFNLHSIQNIQDYDRNI